LSIPEVITHGENGFLVEPGDYQGFRNTVEYVISNFQELHHIRENARMTVNRLFSCNSVADQLINIYRSVLVDS